MYQNYKSFTLKNGTDLSVPYQQHYSALMDKIHCVGFSPDALTADQRARLVALVESSPDMLGLSCFTNLDMTSQEDVPSGIAMYFSPSAPVDATLLSDSLFQVMAVSRIIAPPHGVERLTDAHFTDRDPIRGVAGAVEQHPAQPVHAGITDLARQQEQGVWAPEMGGPNSFAGVYCGTRANDPRQKDYYAVARGTVPLLVQDLKRAIVERAPTYRDLLHGDAWKGTLQNAAYVARRNIERCLANVAESYGVGVVRMDDVGAALAEPHHAPPELAVPEWEQATHSIRATLYDGQPAVVLYNGVVPREDCQLLQSGSFFVVANPYDGISVFPLSEPTGIEAVPSDTGRNPARGDASAHIEAIKARARDGGVTWEQQRDALRLHSDLAPDAFKPVSAEFRATMKDAGWNPEHHVSRLIPVALKLYNDEMERKPLIKA